ncbi:CRISPR-associated helicase/endonuclease Cas3 [Streptomonospora sediminis]
MDVPGRSDPAVGTDPAARSAPSTSSTHSTRSSTSAACDPAVLARRWALKAWGKLGSGHEPHPLVCHAIDTAAVAEALYDIVLSPRMRAELDEGLAPLGNPRAWAAVLCGLHDIGKLSPAFQALRTDAAIELLGPAAAPALRAAAPDDLIGRWDTLHGLVTAAHFDEWLEDRKAAMSLRNRLVDLLGGHHGHIPDPFETAHARRRELHLGGPVWKQARDHLIHEVAGLWGLDIRAGDWHSGRLRTAAAVGLAGLTILSDWTASDPRNFPFRPDPGDLADYREYSRGRARRTLQRLNWTPWRPPAATGHTALFPDDPEPRPLQQAVHDLVAGITRPGVLAIEAPTGEGKSKAGIQAAATLVRNLGLAGMYVATPTRATAGPAHATVNTMLAATGSGLRAHLLYSGARDDLDRAAAGTGSPPPVLMPAGIGPDSDDARTEARETFTKKRALTFPIGVGTVDQALQAVMRSGHVAMRLASLSNKVLVVDEVHSFDAYTSRLLDRLLWWCGRLGTPVVLMSATLAAPRREELVGAWRSGALAGPAAPPAGPAPGPSTWQLTWADDEHRVPPVPVQVSKANTTRRLMLCRIADNHGTIADEVVARMRDRGCAAVIHNSPARAARSHQRLQELLDGRRGAPELLYLDGKTDNEQRRTIEARLAELCGPGSGPGRRNAIVVGTQVLEHGLDTDFDLVVTDPCPADLLIQRAGRLHRHRRRARPAPMADPRLIVVAAGRNGTFPGRTAAIYPKECLLTTEFELSRRDCLRLPDDIGRLVHAAYADPAPITDTRLHQVWNEARMSREITRGLDSFNGTAQCIPPLRDSGGLAQLTKHTVSPKRTRKQSPWEAAEERGMRSRNGDLP